MLEIVDAPVAPRLSGATGEGPVHQASPGRALLELPSIGRVMVEDGARATVERAPEARPEDIAWLLRGPVRQAGWLQRGKMALRGAGVVVGGRAVALIGVTAAGKSAVAAALALRGHPVLTDSALPLVAGGGLVAEGTGDELELWPKAVGMLGLDPAVGRVVRPALAKRAFRFPAARPAPLGAVVVLTRETNQGDPAAEPLHGFERFEVLGYHTAMLPLVGPLGLREDHFRWIASIATQVPLLRVRADRHRRDLGAVADVVERVMA